MKNLLNDNAIREAAYYIWQNNGCPANTSSSDWNAAIRQLSALSALNSKSSSKISASSKKTLAVKTTSSSTKKTSKSTKSK